MTGLDKMINDNKIGSKSKANSKLSIIYLQNIIKKHYQTVQNKLEKGMFTVNEAFEIFNDLFPKNCKILLENEDFVFFLQLFLDEKYFE